jgi:hypothetical protein
METVTVDLMLTVQCGQSLLVPINGKCVLITASVADSDQGERGVPTLEESLHLEAPLKLAPPTVRDADQGLDFAKLDLAELLGLADLDEPADPSSSKHRSFEIEGVGGVHLPRGSVDERHLAALSRRR